MALISLIIVFVHIVQVQGSVPRIEIKIELPSSLPQIQRSKDSQALNVVSETCFLVINISLD